MRTTTCSVTLLLVAGGLMAEDATQPLVVHASRLDTPLVEQPYTVYRIEGEDYARAQPVMAVDALAGTPGVVIQRTAANQASPYLRGLTGEQTLLLFDGVRLNHAMNRGGPNQYSSLLPSSSIAAADVLLGAGGVTTGSDGLTGAVDFQSAAAGRDATAVASPWVRGRYDSADGSAGSAGVDGRAAGLAYSLEGGRTVNHDRIGGKDAGDHLFFDAAGDRTIPNSSYRQWDGSGRLAVEGIPGNRIELNVGRTYQSDAARADGYRQNSNSGASLSRYYDPQTFTWGHLRHILQFDQGPRLQTTGWLHEHHEGQTREDLQNYGTATQRYRRREYDDTITTVGVDLQASQRIADSHALTLGGTGYRDRTANAFALYRSPNGNSNPGSAVADVTTANAGPGQTTVPDGSTYDGQGIFAQDLWSFDTRWDLLGGVRLNRNAWKAEVTNDRLGFSSIAPAGQPATIDGSATAATGNLRLGYHPVPVATLYGGVSQGFRAPNLSNLAGAQDRGSNGFQSRGNPDLAPEKSITYEIGAKVEERRDRASLALFVTELRDLIQTTYVDANGDGRITGNGSGSGAANADYALSGNAQRGLVAGIEQGNDWALPLGLPEGQRLAFCHSISLLTGEMDQQAADGSVSQVHISRANRVFGTVGFTYEPQVQWYVLSQVRWSGPYKETNAGDATDARHLTFASVDGEPGSMPGYAVLDLKAGWKDGRGHLRIDAGLENLGNVSYREVGSGIDGAGLAAVISGEARY